MRLRLIAPFVALVLAAPPAASFGATSGTDQPVLSDEGPAGAVVEQDEQVVEPDEPVVSTKATGIEQALLDATFACLIDAQIIPQDAQIDEVLGAIAPDGTALPPTGQPVNDGACAAGASRDVMQVIAAQQGNPQTIDSAVASFGTAAKEGALSVPPAPLDPKAEAEAEADTPTEPDSELQSSLESGEDIQTMASGPTADRWIGRMNHKQDMSGSTFIDGYGNPTYFNWSSDECSAPLIGNSPWNFKWACRRHDFGYRNLKRGESNYRATNMWNTKNKAVTDRQFREDLLLHCELNYGGLRQPFCNGDARVFHYAVSYYGANTWGVERRTLYKFAN